MSLIIRRFTKRLQSKSLKGIVQVFVFERRNVTKFLSHLLIRHRVVVKQIKPKLILHFQTLVLWKLRLKIKPHDNKFKTKKCNVLHFIFTVLHYNYYFFTLGNSWSFSKPCNWNRLRKTNEFTIPISSCKELRCSTTTFHGI